MKYASFYRPDGRATYGRVHEGRVYDLAEGDMAPPDLKSALRLDALARLPDGRCYALDQIRLQPTIPNPDKVLCVGLNYESHRRETGRPEAAHPAIFVRFADTLIGDGHPIIRPRVSEQLDFEGELAVVIGRDGRGISTAAALDHIAGYSCFNDASVRDWQRHNIQFTPGKNFPATGGFGPWLVTPDDIGDVTSLRVTTRVNDTLVQDQSVNDMIWAVAELISYISAFTPLTAGDVIATGTPGGVGAALQPPRWLKAGDTVVVEIGGVGALHNRVCDG